MPRRRRKRLPTPIEAELLTPLLLDLLLHTSPPGAISVNDQIMRNRAAQARLGELAMRCAERRWPGFRSLCDTLVRQEEALQNATVRA